MYAFCPPVHTDTLEDAERFHRKRILLKTLLKVNRFENATASVSVWTAKTHRFENDDVTVTLSGNATKIAVAFL